MSILEDIRAFAPGCEQEQRDREAMLEFLAVHEDAFLRTNLTAHMTASAWVLSRDRRRVVMVYHNLYRSWSWTGGHADGGRRSAGGGHAGGDGGDGAAAAGAGDGGDLLTGVPDGGRP